METEVSDEISFLSELISENFVNAVMVNGLGKQRCHLICLMYTFNCSWYLVALPTLCSWYMNSWHHLRTTVGTFGSLVQSYAISGWGSSYSWLSINKVVCLSLNFRSAHIYQFCLHLFGESKCKIWIIIDVNSVAYVSWLKKEKNVLLLLFLSHSVMV